MNLGIFILACRRIALRPAANGVVAAALVIASLVASTLLLIETAVARTADRIVAAGPSLVVSRVDAGGWAPIRLSAAEAISRIPGVASAAPRVWGVLPGSPTLTLIGDPALAARDVVSGRGVPDARPGGTMSVRGLDGTSYEVQVKSVLGEGTDTLAFDVLYGSEELARSALLIAPDSATDITVQSVRPEEDDALVREIAQAVQHPVRVVTRAQMRGAWQTRAGARGTVRMIAFIPALIAVVLLAGSLARGGFDARRDAGRLKLMGWGTGDVARLFLTQALLVAAGSIALGLVSAYVIVFPLRAGALVAPLFGWRELMPGLALDTGGAIQVLLLVGAMLLIPALVGAWLPAWRAARADPADLLEAP